MAAISIINTEHFHYPIDFDAEHYHPDRLSSYSRLKKKGGKIIADYFENIIELCNTEHLPETATVFDLTDAIGHFLGNGEICAEINSTKKIAQPGDIIISRLRSYLQELCLVPKRGRDFRPLLSTEFVVLRPRKNNHVAWLLPFLLSKDVQTVLHWAQTGSNHPRFSIPTLLNIPIPEKVLSLHGELSRIVDSAVQQYERSRLLYPDAEAELLERMGWNKLAKKPVELSYVEKFNEIQKQGRYDAEYFQPQYKRLQRHLSKMVSMQIASFCAEPTRGIQPEFVENGEVLVIDSKAVRQQGVDPALADRTGLAFYRQESTEKARLQEGDVLLNSTGRGTLGRATFYNLAEKAIADNHVAIIRPDRRVCLPEYLSLFLNSPAGLAQSEMFQTGSSGQLELYPLHIMQFLVFLPQNAKGNVDLQWQEKLAGKVIQSSKAKAEAHAMLERAKKTVEDLINLSAV